MISAMDARPPDVADRQGGPMVPQGKALVALQGRRQRKSDTNGPLCVATFNPGATSDATCSGPREKEFAAKLRTDIGVLAKEFRHCTT